MERSVFIAAGLFVLSVVSGMLGLGVAFAAVPFLGLFMNDLVHEVQPLSLFLNGVTALFSAFGFARSRLVAWREALLLALVTTLFAPLGSWMAQFTAQSWLWCGDCTCWRCSILPGACFNQRKEIALLTVIP